MKNTNQLLNNQQILNYYIIFYNYKNKLDFTPFIIIIFLF